MSQLLLNYLHLSQEDSIGRLNLTNRSFNALRRSGIRTVGEVARLVESGKIQTIRGLGRKGILEIKDTLARVEIHDTPEVKANADGVIEIEQLNLSNYSLEALRRSGIRTVGEVARLVESGKIRTVFGIERKGILEIKDRLARAEISDTSEVEVNLDIIPREDSIGRLNLTSRSFNVLTSSGIRTVSEIAKLVESGKIQTIRGLGREDILEIKDRLAEIKIQDLTKVDANTPATPRKMNIETIPEHVIKWQSQLVVKQLSTELLHEHAKIADRSVKDWLKIGAIETNTAYEVLASILGSSLNVCEEIEFLLDQIPGQHYLTILLSRYGFNRRTLLQIGQEIGVSRERVRQIDYELKNKLSDAVRAIVKPKSIKDLKDSPTLLKMQSTLLIARDIGLDITYEQWSQRIWSSGLVGNWKSRNFADKDAVEVMIAICNILADCKVPCLQIYENLQYAVQLVASGKPNVPAKILHVCKTLPNTTKRLINRHTKHSGGVYAKWLSEEIETELEEIKNILQGLKYNELSKGWFIPAVMRNPNEISARGVFHRALRKMFQHCGPMSIDNVCSGLRHVLSRTNFPVPPPDVMDEIVKIYGYRCMNGLYYWDGPSDENLRAGETVIMNCLDQIGPVVHHSELTHAFIKSNLSFPALPATLKHSPLFEKIETALYKVRGRSISYSDIKRATAAGNRQSLNPEVEYDTDGNVIVSFTISAIIIGLGTVSCEHFPNLNGEDWNCYVLGERAGKLNVTENEFRHLKKPLELLNCQPGNRLKFIFNTWNRTVTIEKVRTDAKQ